MPNKRPLTPNQKAALQMLVNNGGEGLITKGARFMAVRDLPNGKKQALMSANTLNALLANGAMEPIEGDGVYRITDSGRAAEETGFWPQSATEA